MNTSNNENITALMAAVWERHSRRGDLITLIVRCHIPNSEPTPKDHEDHSHVKCVELLLKAGADVNSHSKEGKTALIAAAENGHHSSVKTVTRCRS